MLSLFACRSLDYRFEPGAADIGVPLIDEPISSADLVLAALRAQVASLTEAQLLRAIEPGELRLNALGRSLTRGAALWPEEAATVSLLARGATLADILRATQSAPRALRLLAALSLLPAVASDPLSAQRFSLLLRKREQVRRTGDARALLDLPAGAEPAAAAARCAASRATCIQMRWVRMRQRRCATRPDEVMERAGRRRARSWG